MRRLLLAAVAAVLLSGCAPAGPVQSQAGSAALMRGFGVSVDEAVAPRVPQVHLRVCGPWGCRELDVPLPASGTMSALPCPSTGDPAAVCGAVRQPGPAPGYGYAPIPELTLEPVTVDVSTPPGAPMAVAASVTVRPRGACADAGPSCADPTPQAEIHISADGSVRQTR
ncbi:lipoprotein [Dactylosporangium sp. CA-052675]|uniref:lipoprotein n=1 Tax=Dactylosporangium sp. CA-052675 TaxID=3239927 RepID=UPI003D8C8824